MCPLQGVIDKNTPLMAAPTAPHPEKPSSGHRGFDRVSERAALARKGEELVQDSQIPFTADAVIALTALALKAEREIDDEASAPRGSGYTAWKPHSCRDQWLKR